jgi:hypothetical protein
VPPGPLAKQRQEKATSQESRLAVASVDVTARLRVAELAAADRALAELLRRVGATEISRRSEAGDTLVELAVPGERWPALRDGLGRLGRLDLEREPAPVPPRVTLRLRISR